MNKPLNGKSYHVTGTLIKAAIVSALGGLLFGFDTAVIAGTTSSVKSLFQLSEDIFLLFQAIFLVVGR